MDVASAASALISGLSLLLDEIHRRGDRQDKRLRASLLSLEDALYNWHQAAQELNRLASNWAQALPASARLSAHASSSPRRTGPRQSR